MSELLKKTRKLEEKWRKEDEAEDVAAASASERRDVVHERLVRARGKASREGMALCLKWIDDCREMGWAEDQLDDLEDLFWKYRDSDGKLRPNGGDEPPRE